MGNPYLIPALSFGPVIVERIVERVDQGMYDQHRDEARFSFREAIAHLADWEPILLQRMRDCFEQEGCEIIAMDEVQRAFEQDYLSKNPVAEVSRWRDLRQETLDFLKKLGQDDWQKWGIHTDRGRQSIYDQANMTACHDTYHVEHLMRFLK